MLLPLFVIALAPELNTTTGSWISSSETIVSVTVSSVLARFVGNPDIIALLFEAIVTVGNVGSVLSNLTLPPPVVTADIGVPTTPATSTKETAKVISPSVSSAWAVYFAVQFILSPLAFVYVIEASSGASGP